MITVSYDESEGLICTVTYGKTSREEMEDYLDRLVLCIERARSEWDRVLHLVDASALDIQGDENLRCLAGAGIEIQKENDKTAVVMTSEPAIRQLSRMPSKFGVSVFTGFAAAKGWLQAPWSEADFLNFHDPIGNMDVQIAA